MLISFTGAQSTGKTTVLDKMLNTERYATWNYVEEVTRLVKREWHVDINESGDDNTQMLIMCQHIHNLIKHKTSVDPVLIPTVLDRCIVDCLIYSRYLHSHGRIRFETLNMCDNIYNNIINDIDVIFYTHPDDVQLIVDDERSGNENFREDIIQEYDMWLKQFTGNVVILRGDVDTRFKQIEDEIIKFNI